MAFLNQQQKDSIRAAIRAAEARTSGELVAVLAQESDGYRFIPVLWAALLALVTPAVILAVSGLIRAWVEPGPAEVYLIQILVFLAGIGVFGLSPLKMALIPAAVKHMRAGRLAHEQFYRQGLGNTEGGTGVLLFVSVAEHYVEIIADRGIHQKVEEGAWDRIVAEFVSRVAEGKVTEGFLSAIDACGTLLQQHFPREDGDVDELPNHLIEI
jgi:putative membrane protein